MIILRQHNYSRSELNRLGRKTDQEIREAVEGTKAEERVNKILDKSAKEMKNAAQKEFIDSQYIDRRLKISEIPKIKIINPTEVKDQDSIRYKIKKLEKDRRGRIGYKNYSKQDREIVPEDIVEKVKNGDGVIQKDHNGDWRIVSMKTKTNKSGKPEFWDARYDSKESAQKALGGYFANK